MNNALTAALAFVRRLFACPAPVVIAEVTEAEREYSYDLAFKGAIRLGYSQAEAHRMGLNYVSRLPVYARQRAERAAAGR